jgi:hypothetical protein
MLAIPVLAMTAGVAALAVPMASAQASPPAAGAARVQLTSYVTPLRPAVPNPGPHCHLTPVECDTDHYLFGVPLGEFLKIRKTACRKDDKKLIPHTDQPACDSLDNKNGKALNWSSDACSLGPLKRWGQAPFGYPFYEACIRHDFGYRNYSGQRRCNRANRKLIDQNFLFDLNTYVCKKGQTRCFNMAKIYYHGVRKLASHACKNVLGQE